MLGQIWEPRRRHVSDRCTGRVTLRTFVASFAGVLLTVCLFGSCVKRARVRETMRARGLYQGGRDAIGCDMRQYSVCCRERQNPTRKPILISRLFCLFIFSNVYNDRARIVEADLISFRHAHRVIVVNTVLSTRLRSSGSFVLWSITYAYVMSRFGLTHFYFPLTYTFIATLTWHNRSTSGWKFKHPGRVGDSPVVGAGLYCDARYGGAVATGDGEEILRTCLSFLVVESMRARDSPALACKKGIERLRDIVGRPPVRYSIDGVGREAGRQNMHERLTVAVMCLSPSGEIGAASTLGPENVHRGRPAFPLAVWRGGEPVRVVEETCLPLHEATRGLSKDT